MTSRVLDKQHEDEAAFLQRARRAIAGGASASGRRVFEQRIVRTEGAYLWDSTQKRYIDYLLNYGATVIGHSDPRVNAAVARVAATCDLHWVGPQAGEVELAEELIELIPSAEKVVFVTSGSDAILHAVHVARAATGRSRLLKFHGSFVGWQDALARGANFDVRPGEVPGLDSPNAQGLSERALADVSVVEWNDFTAVREVFALHGRELAAVVAEPYVLSFGCVPPAPGFLEELRSLCDEHGVVLVFDEVKTGFRLGLNGYQAIAGVTPDMTALGKALGNGYTIAALVGRAPLMELLGESVALDGTHYANPYAIAAARATLDILRGGGMQRLDHLGGLLRQGLTEAARQAGVEATITGMSSSFMINWLSTPPVTFHEAASADFERAEAFRRLMLEEGVLLPPFVITDSRLCLATSESDIAFTVAAARRSFERTLDDGERSGVLTRTG